MGGQVKAQRLNGKKKPGKMLLKSWQIVTVEFLKKQLTLGKDALLLVVSPTYGESPCRSETIGRSRKIGINYQEVLVYF
jgi:hypothetical protein